MDNLEAIKMLEDWNVDLSQFDDEKKGIECHEIAIRAIKRLIPVKTIRVNDDRTDGCPICKREFYEKFNFCPECGNAIEWKQKFQFIPKKGKIINTNSIEEILNLAKDSSLITELTAWLQDAPEDENYFNDEDFEIIRIS